MSRVFSEFPEFPDPEEARPEQRELDLPASRRERAAGPTPAEAEVARAEFFRAQRRPLLPLLGLAGAVATVAVFLWLGREDAVPSQAMAGDLAPVAAAPGLEPPSSSPAPGGLEAPATPGSLAPATAPQPLPMPEVPSVLDGPGAPAPPEEAEALPALAGFAVQLLAARSQADVGASWERLRGAHPDLLATLTPSVTPTSRAQGETFYRLRAGPLRDRASADALCRALSLRQQACFVVSPGS